MGQMPPCQTPAGQEWCVQQSVLGCEDASLCRAPWGQRGVAPPGGHRPTSLQACRWRVGKGTGPTSPGPLGVHRPHLPSSLWAWGFPGVHGTEPGPGSLGWSLWLFLQREEACGRLVSTRVASSRFLERIQVLHFRDCTPKLIIPA